MFPKGIAGIGNNDFTIWGPDKIYAKDYSSFGLQTPQGGKKKKKKRLNIVHVVSQKAQKRLKGFGKSCYEC